MAIAIAQQVADGVLTDFPFTFLIPVDGLVDVYVTPAGAEADEVTDLVSPVTYTLVLNPPVGEFVDGTVKFGVAPLDQEIITITPTLENANIDVDFTQTEQLIPANLNKAFAEHTTPIEFNTDLTEARTPRYNINVNEADLQYSSLLPTLPPGTFWRRNEIANGSPGAGMVASSSFDLTTLNLIYPIGSVFLAGAPGLVPPLDGQQGVVWTLQSDQRALVASIASNAGVTGGNQPITGGTTEDHILTETEMPSHKHIDGTIMQNTSSNVIGAFGTTTVASSAAGEVASDETQTVAAFTSDTGGGVGHKHTIDALFLFVATYIRTA